MQQYDPTLYNQVEAIKRQLRKLEENNGKVKNQPPEYFDLVDELDELTKPTFFCIVPIRGWEESQAERDYCFSYNTYKDNPSEENWNRLQEAIQTLT